MSLEIIVLSMLRTGPMHGYELKRRAERPSFTPLSNNSLYPMLRRFQEQGIVIKTVEQQEGKPSRNVYAITATGRERLTTLLATLPTDQAGNDEEFFMRLSFFEEIPLANRRAIIGARLAALDTAAAKVAMLLGENERKATSEKHEWRGLVMNHVLDTTERERAWTSDIAQKAGVTK